ncbi:hypothetical protein HHL19_36115 [Streptomyces sp. R302]|uniref:hypothetical protein n=1 Tax=unclassified Streptomyces TaxID=2593676 RepID=UPI00145F1872|nr:MULTISPECIES: hypothetical protein [unclassified Streptomyces]NML55506.1 hypothetical protein [Streptomyces sp. R301]NML83937.1 hypothetical protein [Streptomyces sp. R302]
MRLLAESLASQRSVLRCEATEQDINHELRHRLPWTIDGVEIMWAAVTVSADEHARTCAERIARLRSEEELAELARDQLSARIRFMQDEILRTPATARLYLMLEQAGQELPPGTDVDALVKAVQQWHSRGRATSCVLCVPCSWSAERRNWPSNSPSRKRIRKPGTGREADG